VIGTQPDAAPVGAIVNPDGGEAVEAGVMVEPVVTAEDDYGVKSVILKANGVQVASKVLAPYVFTWTPTAAQIGTSVQLVATITDSSGHVTTSNITVPVTKSTGETTTEKEAEEKQKAEEKAAEESKEAAEKAAEEAKEAAKKAAEEKAAAEQQVKEATEAAEAATKAAEESASAATKAAEEKADAAVKAAEAKAAEAAKAAEIKNEEAAKAAKEATEAAAKAAKEANERIAALEKAAQITFGPAIKNTKKGTARLGVDVPAPGPLVISGPGIVKVSGNPTGPGEVQVLITAKGSALKTLSKKGKVTVKVTATLSTSSGTKTKSTAITLVKK
jgi:hypothetical protein